MGRSNSSLDGESCVNGPRWGKWRRLRCRRRRRRRRGGGGGGGDERGGGGKPGERGRRVRKMEREGARGWRREKKDRDREGGRGNSESLDVR